MIIPSNNQVQEKPTVTQQIVNQLDQTLKAPSDKVRMAIKLSPLTISEISIKSQIPYTRLTSIMNRGCKPSLDEAIIIFRALDIEIGL
jgi:hypothetical protein